MKKDKPKTEKPLHFTYQILNIKLISNERSGDDAYRQIVQDIYQNTIIKPVGRGKKAFLRLMFPSEFEGKKYFYGKIARFTDLDSNEWVNVKTRELATMDIDPDLFPNLQETDYVFVPQAHRFIVKLSPRFTVQNAFDFFQKALKEVTAINEDYTVTIQQSNDIFEEIYNAISVEKLFISLSYTNSDDIGEDAAEWLDSQLRESNTKESKMYFESGKNETIKIETPLISGGLKLAVENGEVEAKIKDRQGRIRNVITKNHPEKNRSVAPSETEIKEVVFKEVMTRYRDDKG